MELAKLPTLVLLVASAIIAADAAMYAEMLELKPLKGETKTHHFVDSRLQVHGFSPMDKYAKAKCGSGNSKMYGITNDYEAKVWVKYPCSGKFMASFSSYKPLAAHPGPIAVVGTPLSMEEVTIVTKPENKDSHSKKKVLLKGKLYPRDMYISQMNINSRHCKKGETFGISQSRWKAEVWAIWPCTATFTVTYDAKYPLSPIPGPGEEQQICQLELVMTGPKDVTTEMDGDVVSVELSRKFRGNGCDEMGRHFTKKDNTFTVKFQYHCVAYFKVCYLDSPKACQDVSMYNRNDKDLKKTMPGLILNIQLKYKYDKRTKCSSNGLVVKDNILNVRTRDCSGTYKVCYLKRIATPIQPKCTKPAGDDYECKIIKGVVSGLHATQIVKEAYDISCVTLVNETSSGKCNCPITGEHKYIGRGNKIYSAPQCVADYYVCYKRYSHKGVTCPKDGEEESSVCVDVVVMPGRAVPIAHASAIPCMRMQRLLHAGSKRYICHRKIGQKEIALFKGDTRNGMFYARSLAPYCAGIFTVCYKPDCKAPYKNKNGKCIFVEKRSTRNFVEAATKCNSMGGKLMNIAEPFKYFGNMKNDPDFKDRAFFIGGSKMFEDAGKPPSMSTPPQMPGATPVVMSKVPAMKVKNWHKIMELLKMPNDKPQSSALKILRRYTGYPDPQDLIKDAPYLSRCLTMDFSHEGLDFSSCQDKLHYICEQSFKNSRGARLTPWINMDTRKSYQVESLDNLQRLHKKGELNLEPLTFCNKPVYMECRDAKHPRINYSKYFYRGGENFDRHCEQNAFLCDANKQGRKICPDVEVRFTCPPDAVLTCSNSLVRENCQRLNKECRDTSFGPKCVERTIKKTGKEVIGDRTCNYNNKEYVMKTCVTRGDPQMRTFDGQYISDFNSNAGSFVFFDSKTVQQESSIPDFRVVIHNAPLEKYANKQQTREFDLIINGTKYSFKANGVFEIDGLTKNLIDFSDDYIELVVQNKGGKIPHPKITIETTFCMQIVWDSMMSLYLHVPQELHSIKTGLCGNFNGNPNDDFILPNSKRPVPQSVFTKYYMVKSDKQSCLDCVEKKTYCQRSEYEKLSGPRYCGIFNPRDRELPLVKAIVAASANPDILKVNLKQLSLILTDCMENHCRVKTNLDRCQEIETHLEEVMKDLRIDMKTLDAEIRNATQCTNTEQTSCNSAKHMHYAASYWVKCQATCGTSTSTVDCGNYKASGCTCDAGYYLNADMKCVSSDECAKDCTVDLDSGESFSVKNGETVVVEACVRTVTCDNGELIENITEPCSVHAECSKCGLECKCREGYKGDGRTCEINRVCEFGFKAIGDRCYKYINTPKYWHAAARWCGYYGAHLARYDVEEDITNLKDMLQLGLSIKSYQRAPTRAVYCGKNSRCRVPYNEHAIFTSSPGKCKGYTFENYHRTLITTPTCYGKFYFKSIKGSVYLNIVKMLNISPWIGGNTEVIGFNKRNGLTPFNVDPPRLIDEGANSDLGCYYATLNEYSKENKNAKYFASRKMILKMDTNCLRPRSFICEYENHVQKPLDPLDFIGIPQKMNWQEAQQKCKALGRPLLKLDNHKENLKAIHIVNTQLKGEAWIDAQFQYKKPYYLLKWSQDQTPIIYKHFKVSPRPKNSRRQPTLCLHATKGNGYWKSAMCNDKKYVLCGPPKKALPVMYTPALPVPVASSMAAIQTVVKNKGLSTTICNNPVEIKCRAKSEGDSNVWVSNHDQTGNIITCTKDEISCQDNHGVDCSTLEVQFLCPHTDDQCNALNEIGVSPCPSGMKCFPHDNHYSCMCPPGHSYNVLSRSCSNAKACCSAWGDPHYTTFGGAKFDFMGDCKYLFSGSCEDTSKLTVPHYNIYTKNVKCDKGSCLKTVEIHLRNANVLRTGGARIAQSGDYIFKINVGDTLYKLNNKAMEQTAYSVPGAFKVILKKAYFNLDTQMGLKVVLSGNRLDVFAPEKPAFDMCGLCQKLAEKLGIFKFKNGTSVRVQMDSNRKVDYNQMKTLASEFAVPDPEATTETCDIPGEAPKPCTQQVQREIEGPNMCGAFVNKDSPLKDCFDEVDPKEYFEDCKYDACVRTNRSDAVCAMAKAYVQACLKKGVLLAWRNEDFCPYECGEKEVWRADASCEATCGVDQAEDCNEDPEEGCVCIAGYQRQGDKCMPTHKCGCEVPMPDGSLMNLPIGKSVLMPECTEEVTCELNDDNEPAAVSKHFSLPQNGVCHNGPPATVECAKGFKKNDKDDCERIPGGCRDGFTESDGMCIDSPVNDLIWRHAVQDCSVKDATLALIDTEAKLKQIAAIMVEKKYKSMYIAGRVNAYVDGNQQIKLETRVIIKNEPSDILWNFEPTPYLIRIAVPSDDITPENIDAVGHYLSLVVKLAEGDEPLVVAVPTNTKSHFVCEERDIKPEQAEWSPPCNTDSNMRDEGDQEYLKNMLLNPKCNVCPVPLDVRCSPVGQPAPGQTKKGKCGLNKEGLLYNCQNGEECIDMAVETLCAKDIDECALKIDDCGKEATCVNTVGAYKCKCLNPQYPMMVDGQCQESKTCSMSGPQVKNGYTFNFTGFSQVPGVFSYDCSYVLSAPRKSAYSRNMKVPYIDFALVQDRTSEGLKLSVMGTIYNPQGKIPKAWMINSELLKNKMFMYGQDDQLVKHELNYVSKISGAKFVYKNPGVMMIVDIHNHFKARITMEPFSFQLEVSGELANIMDGVCTLEPEVVGENVFMSPKETEDISVGITKCRPFVEPPLPPQPTYTPVPMTPPPAVPRMTAIPDISYDSFDDIFGNQRTTPRIYAQTTPYYTTYRPQTTEMFRTTYMPIVGKPVPEELMPTPPSPPTPPTPPKTTTYTYGAPMRPMTTTLGAPMRPETPSPPTPPTPPQTTTYGAPMRPMTTAFPDLPTPPSTPTPPSPPTQPTPPSPPTQPTPPSPPTQPTPPSPPTPPTPPQTTTYGAPMRPMTTTLGAPMRPMTRPLPDLPIPDGPEPLPAVTPTPVRRALTQTRTVEQPIEDPEVEILPIIIPPPRPLCDQLTFDFCSVIAEACNFPEKQCLSVLCSGEQCMCEYLGLEKFKYCNQTEDLEMMIDELGCSEDCDKNERFTYSVASNQPTCSEPEILPVEGEDAVDDWEFGCYCEQGFVLSGGECVRKEECGCVLPDGTYKKPFTTWKSDDCKGLFKCHPDGTVSGVGLHCGSNTECVNTEDGRVCQCQDGFFGNPETYEGCQKGTPDKDGSKVCYTYTKSDGSQEERCNCTLGFISNCNDCEDMDECKLGLHDCDLSREKCINVPGGFTCACTEGFKLRNEECVDIDECKEGTHSCGENAGCINTEGSYDCECCAGWHMNDTTEDCERDFEEFPEVPEKAQCCHICNIPQICNACHDCELYEVNYCYIMENGAKVDFPNGNILYKFLCMHGIEFNAKRAAPKECSEVPEEEVVSIITQIPRRRMTTFVPIPTRPTPPIVYKAGQAISTSATMSTSATDDPLTATPGLPTAATTTKPFPTNCNDEDLLDHLPQPPANMKNGPVCGPLNSRIPETYESYEQMVRHICRQVGGPNNLPRGSSITAFSGPCPTRAPTEPAPVPTTFGAPMAPRTTTLGAPMRPQTTTLGAPMRPQTTTLGAPMRPQTTTLGAPMRPRTTTYGAPMRPTQFMTTVYTTLRPPTTKTPTPPTTPMTTTTTYKPRTTTTPKIYVDTYEDIFGKRPTRPMRTTERPRLDNGPIRTTIPPRMTTYEIHGDTYEDIYGRPRTTFRPATTTLGAPMRPTRTYPTYPTAATTLGAPMRPRTEPIPEPTREPFPEGTCEVPPIGALDATPDTPVLYEISYNSAMVEADFKLYGVDADAVPEILKPSTDLISSSTFNPSEKKAIIATLPKGSKMKVPVDLAKIILKLNTPDKLNLYLYTSYNGLVRVVTTFEVDRQVAYSNIFENSKIPLQIYDITPYQGKDDVHDSEGPVIISTHMGVRIALKSDVMCGGPIPTRPQPTIPPVKGCHSDYTGKTYRHGETWAEGDCSNCTCDNGFSACYVMDCFMTSDCEHPRDVPGQCCHECDDVEPPTPTPVFTPWTQWGNCFHKPGKDCGVGKQYRERDIEDADQPGAYQPKDEEIYEHRACFEACKLDNGDVDTSSCPPESVCDYMDPVCGSTSPGPTSSFKSECLLNIKSCHKGNFPIKLYSGMCDAEDDEYQPQICGDGPIRTTVKYEYNDTLEECFGPVTDIKTCSSLLCKGGSKTCCKVTESEPVEVTVSCYSIKPRQFLRFKKHVHYSAVSCGCQDDGN